MGFPPKFLGYCNKLANPAFRSQSINLHLVVEQTNGGSEFAFRWSPTRHGDCERTGMCKQKLAGPDKMDPKNQVLSRE